jgi:hypothetical protein
VGQRERAEKAIVIWDLWSASPSELTTVEDDDFSGEWGAFGDYNADQDPTDHQSRKRRRPDDSSVRSKQENLRKHKSRQRQGQQRRAAVSPTHGSTLVEDVIDFKSDHHECSALSNSDIIATEDEYADESDENYNPLPQYSKLYAIIIKEWAIQIMEGFEELREGGKPILSGIDCGKSVREYAKQRARSPPAEDWTKWKADTAPLWAESLPPRKRHKLSGV